MTTFIYDFEVVAHDWLCVFRNKRTKEFTVIHNDNIAMQKFMRQPDIILAGFNCKRYDQFIMKAILCGYSPEDVKAVNDFIIGGGNGWECPLLADCRIFFNQYDLMDDMQVGTSLKSFEAHYGMNIVESSVDFNVQHKLSEEELEEMIYYCKYDVTATDTLDDLRFDYLRNKVFLGKGCGLSPERSIALTNAKLTAKYLGAVKKEHNDEREYKYPDNLLTEYIPSEVFEFFDKIHDKSISDDELFSNKLDINVGGTTATIGFGGIHAGIPTYSEEASGTRLIRNLDVSSYYPSLMLQNGYCSRNMQSPEVYREVVNTRLNAKKNGDKVTANALKLIVNTTYGATLDKNNPLYDPLMGRSVCISGQLYLLELTNHLLIECKTLKVIQLNTDGIMISFDVNEYDKVLSITNEWQDRTGFALEEDKVKKIVQKDVNNYIETDDKGDHKMKGGMLVRGVGTAGAFKINNNATIVAYALARCLADGVPVATTINDCNELDRFAMVARASSKYKGAYHQINGVMMSVQKCNRIYASVNPENGSLYKMGYNSSTFEKIAGIPLSCIIDNDNHCSIEDIDKDWYINLAQQQVDMFLGSEKPKVDTRSINRLKAEIINLITK